MNVLVDTTVWSVALRRKSPSPAAEHRAATGELRELIREMRACIIGPIRQELLSGIRTASLFKKLQDDLRAFPDLALEIEDYEAAAKFCTLCRQKGVQGSHIDFLICAAAARRGLPVFTLDKDFGRYSKLLGFAMHVPR
jgi:predicted nucleic acid-binding protein